ERFFGRSIGHAPGNPIRMSRRISQKRPAARPALPAHRGRSTPPPPSARPVPPPLLVPPVPVEELDEEEDDDEEEEAEAPVVAESDDSGVDDALGVYLRQMGAIPLLNRGQELALAIRLEKARDRFRHAALLSGAVLQRVVATFRRVAAGEITIDPVIDVVTSRNQTRVNILARMPHHIRTLGRLL